MQRRAAQPVQLFNAQDVAKMIGVSRWWVKKRAKESDELAPQFCGPGQGGSSMMWDSDGVDRWRRHVADTGARPAYSCLNAVNQLGSLTLTWKLWWRPLPDGQVRWYFSTPRGWFVSGNDGKLWTDLESMRLDGGYRYLAVNPAAVSSGSSTAAVLRSCNELRRRIETQEAVA